MAQNVNAKNMFARVTTFSALEDYRESMLSPENLYADGERTASEAKALSARIQKDYQERRNEIVFI